MSFTGFEGKNVCYAACVLKSGKVLEFGQTAIDVDYCPKKCAWVILFMTLLPFFQLIIQQKAMDGYDTRGLFAAGECLTPPPGQTSCFFDDEETKENEVKTLSINGRYTCVRNAAGALGLRKVEIGSL